MCITFFHTNSDRRAPYRLILIANRDEFYHRKSKVSDYWDNDPNVLGGLDLSVEPYGTWLAASKNGKIGVLLNIQQKENSLKKVESRGVLVSNYVRKDDIRAEDYVRDILNSTKVYNGYHLLLFTITAEHIKVRVLTNCEYGRNIEVNELTDGNHGLSNCPIVTPYKKVIFGKEQFEEIVKKYNTLEQKEILVAELKKLLKSQLRNYPDAVLYESKKDFMPPSQIEKLSSIFVNMPENNYGTRTHTIILIDWRNKMDYREYTMAAQNNNMTDRWDYRKFEVQLEIKNE